MTTTRGLYIQAMHDLLGLKEAIISEGDWCQIVAEVPPYVTVLPPGRKVPVRFKRNQFGPGMRTSPPNPAAHGNGQ